MQVILTIIQLILGGRFSFTPREYNPIIYDRLHRLTYLFIIWNLLQTESELLCNRVIHSFIQYVSALSPAYVYIFLLLFCISNTEWPSTRQACQPWFLYSSRLCLCLYITPDLTTVWACYIFCIELGLANIANIYIFIILYDCCLNSVAIKTYKYGILNSTCKSRDAVYGKLPMLQWCFFFRRCNFQRWLSTANSHELQA